MTVYFSDFVGAVRQRKILLTIVKESYRSCPTPFVFGVWYTALRYICKNRVEDLEALLAVPAVASTAEETYAAAQIRSLFSKRDDLDHGVDRAAAALDAFLKSEELCRETNAKLRDRDDPDYRERAVLLFKMQRKISQILGPLPDPAQLKFGFGPGSNVGCSKNTNVASKLDANATTTVGALRYLLKVFDNPYVAWPGLSRVKVVASARFATVSKKWNTDRGILIESIINTFLQKGWGAHIRGRLRCFGINLSDQSINRSMALKASRSGSHATIDLKMASDTIAFLLVMDLLPIEWFDALYACRSHRCELPDGSIIELEKFSSMGNGYTFELESLIFYSLLLCVCSGPVSVYGDDLIVPSEDVEAVYRALRLLGFVPNEDKSFHSGPFRESCGGDFFDGVDVRPFYLKTHLRWCDLVRVHNSLRSSGRLPQLLPFLIRLVPKELREFGPAGLGDGHFHSDSLPCTRDKRGWDGVRVKYKTFAAVRKFESESSDEAQKAAFLYFNTFKQTGDLLFEDFARAVRPRVPRYRKRTLTALLPSWHLDGR